VIVSFGGRVGCGGVPPYARWQAGWSGISRISLSPFPMIERNNLADPASPC